MMNDKKKRHGKLIALVCVISIIAGVCMVSAGVGMGGIEALEDVEVFGRRIHVGDVHPEYGYKDLSEDSVDSIKLDIPTNTTVSIVEGDGFYINYHYLPEAEPKFSVKDGVLSMSVQEADSKEINVKFDPENYDYVIGDVYVDSDVTIYVPAKRHFKTIELNTDYNMVSVNDVEADKISVTGNGEVQLSRVNADTVELRLEGGEASVGDCDIKNMKADIESGYYNLDRSIVRKSMDLNLKYTEAEIVGSLSGETKIALDDSDMNLSLTGDEEEYSYRIDCEDGDATVNDEEYQGAVKNKQAKNDLTITAKYSDVAVWFNAVSGD